MPQLIVTEKIDGNPVAWRCSDCSQGFSARGKLTTKQRNDKVEAEFKGMWKKTTRVKALVPWHLPLPFRCQKIRRLLSGGYRCVADVFEWADASDAVILVLNAEVGVSAKPD